MKWSVCRTREGNPCLYSERGRSMIERQFDGPAYCIRHKAELEWAYRLYGKTRAEARKILTDERRKRNDESA